MISSSQPPPRSRVFSFTPTEAPCFQLPGAEDLDLLEFGIRQFRILRLNDRLMHFGMLAALAVPITGFFAAIQGMMAGGPLAAATLLLVGASSILRQQIRRDIVRRTIEATPFIQDPARSYDGVTRLLWWPIFFFLPWQGRSGVR